MVIIMKILFQGDSITDAGRNYEDIHNLGFGYPKYAAENIRAAFPDTDFEFINLGISGNQTKDLVARLQNDFVDVQPDIVSILIGINDVDSPYNDTGTDIVRWEKIYRMLIEETKERLPDVKIILCEPFCLYLDEISSRSFKWRSERIPQYRELLKRFSADYGCRVVWLQEKMNELSEKCGVKTLLFDGTHPNIAGSKLIAEEWLKVFKSLEAETDRK